MDNDEERDVIAMAMVLLAEEHPTSFRRGEVSLSAPAALLSPRLVADLMRLGAFCSNLHREYGMAARGDTRALPGENIVMALAFDHAVETAPRLETDHTVIDLDILSQRISEVEGSGRRIEIDHDMVARVVSAANFRLEFGTTLTPAAAA